jgi:hypothetical protein
MRFEWEAYSQQTQFVDARHIWRMTRRDINERCVAFRIKWDGRGEYCTASTVHLLEALHACVKHALTAARKSQCRNSIRIYSRMVSEALRHCSTSSHGAGERRFFEGLHMKSQ